MLEVKHPDPSALGLFGLAMVTLVASSQKLGITNGLSYVIPWAIFLGGFAQIVAGILDYKKNNVFGATAFFGYGFFWLAVVSSWLINMGVFGEALKNSVDTKQLAFAFLGYLIFTIFMTIGALETNKVLFTIFFLIDFLFVGLFLSTYFPEGAIHSFGHGLASYSELLIAMFSFYGSGANVLNNHFGKQFLPIGKPFGIIKKG